MKKGKLCLIAATVIVLLAMSLVLKWTEHPLRTEVSRLQEGDFVTFNDGSTYVVTGWTFTGAPLLQGPGPGSSALQKRVLRPCDLDEVAAVLRKQHNPLGWEQMTTWYCME